MKNGILFLAAGLLVSSFAQGAGAGCVSNEFVSEYCYFGLPANLTDSAISITPRQFGYEAAALVEVKIRENVELVVTCEEREVPVRTFVRARKDERRIISEQRYKSEDAVADVKAEYARMRVRLSPYLCGN